MSYPGHSSGDCYPSAEKQSVYSTAPAAWAILYLCPLVFVTNSDFCEHFIFLEYQDLFPNFFSSTFSDFDQQPKSGVPVSHDPSSEV